MATIIKKNGAFFTKNQDGLMAVSDPVQLRDLTSGRTPYVDESYSVADKFATPNVSSPSSSGVTPVPMAPGQNQGTPYDKFNLALMGMLKEAQAQSGNMSANKNLASLQSQQAGQITGPVGEQFAGASPSQINSILSGRAETYEPAINETAAVIQAKTQKMNQFNNLVTQARAIGEDFAKNLVPDEETLQNYRDLIEADPSQMSTILSAAGNDKTRQKILGSIDFSKLGKNKKVDTQVIDLNGRKVMIDSTNGDIIKDFGPGGGSDEVLSVTEAQALGVPYGTTKSQAVGLSVTGKPTVEQSKARQFAVSAANGEKAMEDSGYELGYVENPWMPNVMKSNARQVFEQGARAFVNSVLRRESGATVTDDEFKNKYKELIPQAGDGPDVLATKKIARQAAIQSITEAGGSMSSDSGDDEYQKYLESIK